MTSSGYLGTSVAFDTNTLPNLKRPSLPDPGTYNIEVKAQRSDGSGGWITYKTISKTVTAQ